MTAAATSAQAYEGYPELPERRGYEYLDGKWVKIPMGSRSAEVAGTIFFLLRVFVLSRGLGKVLPGEASYQMWPEHPRRYRKPDGSFIPRGLLPDGPAPGGHIHAVPHLVIEVISPFDRIGPFEEKVGEYFDAGVSVIWAVHPERQTVHVRHPDGSATVLGPEDTLTGEDFLPGFAVKVAEIFA